MRDLIRILALTAFWLSVIPAAWWAHASVAFLSLQPARIQRSLFGEQLVGIFALRSVHDECCLFPLPDGFRAWEYEIPAGLEARLAGPCSRVAPPGGLGLIEPGSRECIVAQRLFGRNGVDGGVDARLVGGRLRLSWSQL